MRMFDRFAAAFAAARASLGRSMVAPVSVGDVMTARGIAQWNMCIPKRAVRVDRVAGGVRYLHPTKGWRFVSDRRLGLA